MEGREVLETPLWAKLHFHRCGDVAQSRTMKIPSLICPLLKATLAAALIVLPMRSFAAEPGYR